MSQQAILNINTASDINIYNNAFIVQSSPSHNNQGKQKNQNSRAVNAGSSHTNRIPSSNRRPEQKAGGPISSLGS